jgi:3',5'-cyclic AMP phosphodiesterase CpdA
VTRILHVSDLHFGRPAVPLQVDAIERVRILSDAAERERRRREIREAMAKAAAEEAAARIGRE